ncbi:MAG: HDOD domain-containing protein [Methylobacter sp.]
MPTFENKFARLAGLPSMPVLLMEAVQQINGKQNLPVLVDKITQDPSMAVRILRIANSPFYGMSREIGSLREAVVLLGLNRIRDMLISICFSKMLPARHKDFDYNLFWRHSMAVAECTRQLANCTSTSPDLAFTAGLLHDIGDLVIVMLFPDEFCQLIQLSATFGIEAEQKLLGFDHATLGGKAAQYWNLPQEIQEAIEQHETPPEPDAAKSLKLLVYTANLLIINVEQSDKSALEEHESIRAALAILNVSTDLAAHCTDNGQQFADQILTLA